MEEEESQGKKHPPNEHDSMEAMLEDRGPDRPKPKWGKAQARFYIWPLLAWANDFPLLVS